MENDVKTENFEVEEDKIIKKLQSLRQIKNRHAYYSSIPFQQRTKLVTLLFGNQYEISSEPMPEDEDGGVISIVPLAAVDTMKVHTQHYKDLIANEAKYKAEYEAGISDIYVTKADAEYQYKLDLQEFDDEIIYEDSDEFMQLLHDRVEKTLIKLTNNLQTAV